MSNVLHCSERSRGICFSFEQGLSEIKRSLSSEEQAIVAQIRTFLKQAKQALATGDSDGALTLATKAKLLLDELTKH